MIIAHYSPDAIGANRQPACPGAGHPAPAEPGRILLVSAGRALRNGLSNGLIWPQGGWRLDRLRRNSSVETFFP
jgi:hypothetical protein